MKEVFEKQLGIIQKFSPKEHALGSTLTDDLPVNVNTHAGQRRLRECISRLNEELFEFSIADKVTQGEEFIDGLHFLVDLYIRVGLTHVDLPVKSWLANPSYWSVAANGVQRVWMEAMSFQSMLKLKDWREKAPPLEMARVQGAVRTLGLSYIKLARTLKWDEGALIRAYNRKHGINLQRQESGY